MANVLTPIIMIVLLCALYVKLGNMYMGKSKKVEECDLCGHEYELGFLTKKRCEICESYDKWILEADMPVSYRAFQVRGYPFCITCGVRKDKGAVPLSEEVTTQAYPDGFTCCKCENVYMPNHK